MKTLEELSDKELVFMMNNGQKEKAFNILYKRHKRDLYGFCFKRCKSSKLTNEFVFLTFEKFFEKSATFIRKPNCTFKTWLYAIAKNSITDYYRLEAKHKNLFLFDSNLDPIYGENSALSYSEKQSLSKFLLEDFNPEKIQIKKQKKEYVKNCLEKIKEKGYEKHYILLKLRYYDDLPLKDISDKLKISVGNVKATLFHAKGFLEEELKSKKYFLED